MDREDAIEYLKRKGHLDKPYLKRKEREFSDYEERQIKRVMKEGKIYGDPLVVLNG